MKEQLDTTVCIPVRIDSPERLRNLEISIRYFRRYFNLHIHILEGDSAKNAGLMQLLATDTDIAYTFIPDSDPIFHRTRYLNIMIKYSKTKTVVLQDTDIIVPPTQLISAVKLAKNNFCLVSPYAVYGFWNLENYSLMKEFSTTQDISALSVEPTDFVIAESSTSPAYGGSVIVNREQYYAAGLENEYCRGWGYEDRERVDRILRLGYPFAKLAGHIYHLPHPRGINSGGQHPFYARTEQEWLKIRQYTYSELKNYIMSWEWTHDNPFTRR